MAFLMTKSCEERLNRIKPIASTRFGGGLTKTFGKQHEESLSGMDTVSLVFFFKDPQSTNSQLPASSLVEILANQYPI